MKAAKARGFLTVLKKPLPIRKPLADLDRDALGPFEVLSVRKLGADIVQELGTEEYINWVLVDSRPKKSAFANVFLSITYYTDVLDQVPHVAEECYFQGAFSPAGDETLMLKMDRLGREIPVRRLSFFPPREFVKKTYVYYTIRVNDAFYANRQAVRWRMGSTDDTHLYYSKVEVGFQNVESKDLGSLDRRARALFALIIIELEKSHWPKNEAEPAGGEQAGRSRWRLGTEHIVDSAMFLHPERDGDRIVVPAISDEPRRGSRVADIEVS